MSVNYHCNLVSSIVFLDLVVLEEVLLGKIFAVKSQLKRCTHTQGP